MDGAEMDTESAERTRKGLKAMEHGRMERRVGTVVRVGAACVLSVLGLAACSSPGPHARMSGPEIEARLEDEFPVGTPQDAVIDRLRQKGATYDSPLPLTDPAGWSTMRVFFDQPWWAGLQWSTTYRKTEAWADMLFDQGQILREVQAEVRERTW